MISIALLAYYTWLKSPVLTHGFASYYTSAKLLASGGDMAAVYDSAYFYPKMREYGFGNVTDPANIPGGAIMLLPFTMFEPVTAKILWNIFSLICLFASILILLKALQIKLSSPAGYGLILITLLFYPAYYNIAYGQAYLFLLLIASLAVYGFSRSNILLLSVALALMVFVKGYGIFPLAALLFLKRYKEFALTLLFIVLLFAASLPVFGITGYTEYYSKFYSLVAYSNLSSNTAYQTLNSLFGHLLSYNSQTNPNALAAIPQYILYYAVQVFGFSLLAYFIIPQNKIKPAANNIASLVFFSLSFAMNVLFAPGAEDYHSVLYLPLLFAAASVLWEQFPNYRPGYIIFVLALIMMAFPLPFRQLQQSGFPLYLFAYPRLYGAMLLCFFTFWLIRKGNHFENLQKNI